MSKIVPVAVMGGAAGGLFDAYAYLRDEKSANTAGGGITHGSFQTRDLNTEVVDADGIVSLSSNQFTLQAGSYYILGRAPTYQGSRHKAKIRNVTDSTDALIGTSEYSPSGTVSASIVRGVITIASAKTFELQHHMDGGGDNSQDGGVSANAGVVEVYSEVEIFRFA